MNSMEMSSAGIRAREEALRQMLDGITPENRHAALLENPDRRHEAQGIGVPDLGTSSPNMGRCGPSLESELILELKAFALDCASPDHYAHALPLEVVVRAGRLKNMMAAVRGERPSGIGYQEPPPARCEACDSE